MPFKILIALAFWTTIGVACSSNAAQPTPIEFRRAGGIVGLDDQLMIDEQGHAELTRRAGDFGFDLTQDEFTRLRAALRDANFKAIPKDSRRKPYLVPDEISYVIVYTRAHCQNIGHGDSGETAIRDSVVERNRGRAWRVELCLET